MPRPRNTHRHAVWSELYRDIPQERIDQAFDNDSELQKLEADLAWTNDAAFNAERLKEVTMAIAECQDDILTCQTAKEWIDKQIPELEQEKIMLQHQREKLLERSLKARPAVELNQAVFLVKQRIIVTLSQKLKTEAKRKQQTQ